MDKSFLIKVKNNLTIKSLKKLNKELRENIIKCLDEERKTNVKLDKSLYEYEKDMFGYVMKDIVLFDLEFENRSELRDLIWLYSSLMDNDKNLENVKLGISYFKVMRD